MPSASSIVDVFKHISATVGMWFVAGAVFGIADPLPKLQTNRIAKASLI